MTPGLTSVIQSKFLVAFKKLSTQTMLPRGLLSSENVGKGQFEELRIIGRYLSGGMGERQIDNPACFLVVLKKSHQDDLSMKPVVKMHSEFSGNLTERSSVILMTIFRSCR